MKFSNMTLLGTFLIKIRIFELFLWKYKNSSFSIHFIILCKEQLFFLNNDMYETLSHKIYIYDVRTPSWRILGRNERPHSYRINQYMSKPLIAINWYVSVFDYLRKKFYHWVPAFIFESFQRFALEPPDCSGGATLDCTGNGNMENLKAGRNTLSDLG